MPRPKVVYANGVLTTCKPYTKLMCKVLVSPLGSVLWVMSLFYR